MVLGMARWCAQPFEEAAAAGADAAIAKGFRLEGVGALVREVAAGMVAKMRENSRMKPKIAMVIGDPAGIGPELVLQSLTVGPVGQAGQGSPLMLNFGRPYNNLSIPGGTVGALLTITGAEPQSASDTTPVVFGRFILRGLGTAVQQAVAQHPTFVAMWAGGNDYLGAALAGTPTRLTSVADFKTRYESILDQVIAGAPGAGMVVGSLPNQIPPYFTLVPPYLINPATGQPVLGHEAGRDRLEALDVHRAG